MNCRTNYPVKRALVAMENENLIDMEDETTKYCVSWVTCKVVEIGLSYAVGSWNSHPIPGKGVPDDIRLTSCQTSISSPHVVPSTDEALRLYQGKLTIEQKFGVDPLQQQEEKQRQRETLFNRHFPCFNVIFHEVANNQSLTFRSAILYYLNLTRYLVSH